MPSGIIAQTCSCAGAPLLNSQSMGAVKKGNVVLGVTADFNKIDKLYSGADELNNRSSERETFTSLFEVNYGLSSRFTFSGTFSFVQKSRTTGLQGSINSRELETSGIGDAVVMLKYDVIEQTLWRPYQLMVGGGVKAPIGSNSIRTDGIALNADMQPGTGSWDGIGWALFSYTLRSQNMSFYTINSFKKNSSASRFSQDDQYRFGDELNSILGVSRPAYDRFSLSLQLKFRAAEADLRNDSKMPSTGGEWMNLAPGLGYTITDRFSIQLAGEVPVYQNVNGTQPTTTYKLTASLFFSLKRSDSGFRLGLPNQE
jgi:hypothetical protein